MKLENVEPLYNCLNIQGKIKCLVKVFVHSFSKFLVDSKQKISTPDSIQNNIIGTALKSLDNTMFWLSTNT